MHLYLGAGTVHRSAKLGRMKQPWMNPDELIAVMKDDLQVREWVIEELTKMGYTVTTPSMRLAEEGIERLRRRNNAPDGRSEGTASDTESDQTS